MAVRGRLTGSKIKSDCVEAYEKNDTISLLIYYLSKQFLSEFMVWIASYKSSSIQHDVHFVYYGPV